MKLYFTRHGKTEWNQELRFQGMTGDSPLLPTSYEEIKLLGQTIKNVPFEKIFSSTSLRARKTAEGINQELEQPVEIIFTDELKELGLGKLEGQSIMEMRKIYSDEMNHMRYRLDRYNPEVFQGEPIEQAISRISSVVQAAVDTGDGPYLFVGHGASLTAAIQSLSGKELGELRSMGGLKNNSLSILETKNDEKEQSYTLKLWNDDSFLQ
ncbi:phosphoglycerate mutase [Enterococcus haemoperoxidus ATCC BAA-382]|uniref:phosphoglycerate mutase (2,3-diphosphoglycerate-dependent) n=1 Tax=Enterococcus haemoperoxidus ATCC BAA-382 TaxID=1158608 RepID=R2SVW3_9ENTE|nr:histidine phosphatase family protein [Enterococcus haemoperoxidus]EOH99370.1 phosphoglycerate mutase [Enterococcus haemoperoxidus ATCC BAA-382]EOT62889.1 phosphoglycerate mutase [Enterococcus haemoperoxidus ATCC BAA-382]OJG54753.1 phosphoglycerate mutase [Enterococcus haemoperoxidus]